MENLENKVKNWKEKIKKHSAKVVLPLVFAGSLGAFGYSIKKSHNEVLNLSERHIESTNEVPNLENKVKVYLSNNEIKNIGKLANSEDVKTLSLYGNHLEEVENIPKNVRNLDVSHNGIEKITEEGLNGLEKLRWLRAQENPINYIGGLEELPNLKYMDLSLRDGVEIELNRRSYHNIVNNNINVRCELDNGSWEKYKGKDINEAIEKGYFKLVD